MVHVNFVKNFLASLPPLNTFLHCKPQGWKYGKNSSITISNNNSIFIRRVFSAEPKTEKIPKISLHDRHHGRNQRKTSGGVEVYFGNDCDVIDVQLTVM